MTNPSGPISHHAHATPHNTPQHTTSPPLPTQRRGRHRAARPYLAVLPEPETLVLPVITDDMQPPPPVSSEHRAVGPWLEQHERHEHTAPADDMAELAALTRQLIAQRPDLAHPAHPTSGVRR